MEKVQILQVGQRNLQEEYRRRYTRLQTFLNRAHLRFNAVADAAQELRQTQHKVNFLNIFRDLLTDYNAATKEEASAFAEYQL